MKFIYVAIIAATTVGFPLVATCELDGAACDTTKREDKSSCLFDKTLKLIDKLLAAKNIRYVVFGSYAAHLTGVPLRGENFPGDVDVAVSNPKVARKLLADSECFEEKSVGRGVSKYVSKLGTNIDLVDSEDFGFTTTPTVKKDGVTIPTPVEVLKMAILRPEFRGKERLIVSHLIARYSDTFAERDQARVLSLLKMKSLAPPTATWEDVVTGAKTVRQR